MSPDQAVEQVAIASDPADTSVAQAEQAQATQGEAAEANGAATPQPELKAEVEKLNAELTKERSGREAAEKRALTLENIVRTQAGAQSATDRKLNEMSRKLDRMGQVVKAGATSASPEEIAKLEADHEADERASFNSFAEGLRRTNAVALQAAGFSEADLGNEELADGLALWKVASSRGDREGIEEAGKSLARGIKRMQAAKTTTAVPAAAPPPTPAAASGNGAGRRIANMDIGASSGMGAESLQALVNRLASGKRMTDAEIARAREAMDNKGIYPD